MVENTNSDAGMSATDILESTKAAGKPAKKGVPKEAIVKLAIEMGPLFIFFGTYFIGGKYNAEESIYWATGAFMVSMIASMIASWRINGHIPPMLWVSGGVVAVMGGLTLYLHDDTFIKVKPTIVNGIFAVTLFAGLAFGQSLLKPVFSAAFPPIKDEGWRKLTLHWACFFLFLAILNEVVWRNFSRDFWVTFKVWGTMPITFAFMLTQMPVMNRYLDMKIDEEDGKPATEGADA
ncbi:MAG: septation protein A [Pseudomonadota bacterium]